MNLNAKPSEVIGVLAAINPAAQAAGTANSGWVSAANVQRLRALILIGALGSSATVDAKLQQATDSSGTGAKDITGKAIAQHTTGNNKQCIINLNADDLDVEGGFTFVQLSITVATATTGTAGVVESIGSRFMPVTQPAAVTQAVD